MTGFDHWIQHALHNTGHKISNARAKFRAVEQQGEA